MRLISFNVQHYKSLRNVTLDLRSSPILLVGENASGKSNIIDALRFIRDALKDSLDHAISVRGGIDALRQYAPTRPYKIAFRFNFEHELVGGESTEAFYELKVSSTGSGNYVVDHEEAEWYEQNHEWQFDEDIDEEPRISSSQIVRYHLVRSKSGKVIFNNNDTEFHYPVDELALSARWAWSEGAHEIHACLITLRFSSLYPNILRNPSRPETDRFLKEDGENWASVLKSMRKTERGKRGLARILEMMRQVMPSLVDVQVKGIGGYLVPQFLVKDTPSGKAHFFDPIQLSDGTLRAFGILLALYHAPRISFLAIEEPEQTVNPGVLGVLADAFKEISEQTQLIVTSHSPNLVDYFPPESIRVVAMRRGETICSAIKDSQVESVKRRLMSLRELMMLDGLQPDE